MEEEMIMNQKGGLKKGINMILFILCGLLVNILFSKAAIHFGIPLYLDNIGTMLSAVLGGFVPGALVGYLTNLINGIADTDTIYYGVISILIAITATVFHRKGWLKKPAGVFAAVVSFALIGGGIGSVLTWMLYGQGFGTGISSPLAHFIYDSGWKSVFWAQLAADLVIDFADKAITLCFVLLLLRIIPDRLKDRALFNRWRQRPLTPEEEKAVKKVRPRIISLQVRILIVFSAAMLIIALVTTGISFSLFHEETINSETKMGYGVSEVAAQVIDPERIDEYMALGEKAPGYKEAETVMCNLLKSSADIEYVYVYQIQEDGCHVVFDPDTEDTPGAEPGEIIPFDDAFRTFLPDLLAGREIEPVVSNESFGWLLTLYRPVYNNAGDCVCYIGVDISMRKLAQDELSFITKVFSLFAGFFLLLLVIGLWLTKYSVILPVKSMAMASDSFAFNNESSRQVSLEILKSLRISTGDELENLYHAFSRTSEEMMEYIKDVQEKNDTISRMQNNLIMVMADMVESRDQYTGDHVKKTSAYTRIIMEEMKREGIYPEIMTDEFMTDVEHSAPLHDIGKITVPDAILNKPGRLTDEEFDVMKGHAQRGQEILENARDAVSESSYLKEAENLARYHHEKWNGSGYPCGLSEEEIPLSARIMAVADVFDALVSKRSYKEGFPIEKALSIIREGIGTHFDPKVAGAFLNAEAEIRKIAAEQGGDKAEDKNDAGASQDTKGKR